MQNGRCKTAADANWGVQSKKKQRLFGCFLNLDVDATLGTVKQKSRNKEAVVTAKTALQLIATT